MPSAPSDRIRWAIEALDIQPNDRVLEIGSGHGVAVSLVCDRLVGGQITAIDRSPKMVAMARARNQAHVEAGRATIVQARFPGDEIGAGPFNTIFAIHVPLLRDAPDPTAAALRRLLAPGGSIWLIGQTLRDDTLASWIDTTSERLRAAGFHVHSPRVSRQRPPRTAAVSASHGPA